MNKYQQFNPWAIYINHLQHKHVGEGLMVLLATADYLLLLTSDLASVTDEMEWIGSPLYTFLHSATTT